MQFWRVSRAVEAAVQDVVHSRRLHHLQVHLRRKGQAYGLRNPSHHLQHDHPLAKGNYADYVYN